MNFLTLSEAEEKVELLKEERRRKNRLILILFTGIVMAVATIFSLVQWQNAERLSGQRKDALKKLGKSIEEADDAKNDALEKKVEAEKQRIKADSLADEAVKEKVEAQKQKEKADSLADEALKQKEKAEKQKEKADSSADEADRQKEKADSSFREAEKQKDKAIKSKEDADRLRSIAGANENSSKSILASNDKQFDDARKKALMAYDTLFKYRTKNYPQVQNTLNYEALHRVWMSGKTPINSYPSQYDIKDIALNPARTGEALIGELNGTLRIVNYTKNDRSYQSKIEIKTAEDVKKVAYIADSTLLVLGTNGAITILNPINKNQNTEYKKAKLPISLSSSFGKGGVSDFTFLNNKRSKYSLITFTIDHKLSFYKLQGDSITNLENLTRQMSVVSKPKTSLCLKTNFGFRIYVLTDANELIEYTINDKITELSSPVSHGKLPPSASMLRIHPSGKYAAYSLGKSIEVLCFSDGKTKKYDGHIAAITDLNFSHSPDNFQLVSSSRDNTVRIWPFYEFVNSTYGTSKHFEEEPIIITEKRHWINTVEFTSDDQWIIIGGVKGLFNLWPANTKVIEQKLRP